MATKALNCIFKIILTTLLTISVAKAESSAKFYDSNRSIKITKGHSHPLRLGYDIDTLAIGDPNVIQVATLKPNLIMISGQTAGTTSLTIFNADSQHTTYVVNVVNDTTILKTLLRQIEPNVYVENLGDTILLKGSVKTAAALSRVLTIADRFASNESVEFS